jgi:LysM repeat protein
MSTPNPLLPQGSLQQQSKGKSNLRIAVFTIVAIHVVLFGGLLVQGCNRKAAPVEETNSVPPIDNTGIPPLTNEPTLDYNTNLPADTNAPAPDYTQPTNTPLPTDTSTGAVSLPPTNVSVPPDTTPVPAVAPSGEMQVHAIAKGETLSTIAKKYHVTVRAIQDANPNVNPTRLQIGQKLNIPASANGVSTTSTTSSDVSTGETTVYTVKSGDALEKIARNFGTTAKAIKAANNLKTDRINVGQKLKIPAKTGSTNP